jgi:tRNA (cmo5U34)-methyltransferase
MSSLNIKSLFDAGAASYDGKRRKVIYCFDNFYSTLIELIPFSLHDRFSFLDLGAGTGLVSSLILDRFPNAEAHVLDVSENMLSKARERFAQNSKVHFYIQDYAQSPLHGSYQLIVSAMSIHHLPDAAKQKLIQKIFDALTPHGYFINADLTLGSTDATDKICQKHWQNHLETIGLEEDELSEIRKRMDLDQPAPLEHQLRWMRQSGFEDVDCFFKHYSFVVYSGKKPWA